MNEKQYASNLVIEFNNEISINVLSWVMFTPVSSDNWFISSHSTLCKIVQVDFNYVITKNQLKSLAYVQHGLGKLNNFDDGFILNVISWVGEGNITIYSKFKSKLNYCLKWLNYMHKHTHTDRKYVCVCVIKSFNIHNSSTLM